MKSMAGGRGGVFDAPALGRPDHADRRSAERRGVEDSAPATPIRPDFDAWVSQSSIVSPSYATRVRLATLRPSVANRRVLAAGPGPGQPPRGSFVRPRWRRQ